MNYSPTTFRNALTEARMKYNNELQYHRSSRKVTFTVTPTHSSTNMTTRINLPHMIDVWNGRNLRKQVSIQIKLLFDDTNNIQYLVSSDQKQLTVWYNTKAECPTDPTTRVIEVGVKREATKVNRPNEEQLKESLKYHPRVIARLVSVRQNGNPFSDSDLLQKTAPNRNNNDEEQCYSEYI
jgi:hypothetical protein